MALLLTTLWTGYIALPGHAQQEGFMITNDTADAYRRVPEIENQLYGHAYPNQSLSQRIVRIERTLFGGGQSGPLEVRMKRIEDRMNEKNSQQALAEQEPLLAYLEEKLFQRTFEERPLPDRLKQLEMQVFGHSYDHYPNAVRMKKLTYAMPLMAREIRVSKDDMVIASTARHSQRIVGNAPPWDVVQLDASAASTRVLPKGMPLSSGDYYEEIYRNPGGGMLRWSDLPILVYTKPGSPETAVTTQAIRAWQQFFSVEPVGNAAQANVIVSWEKEDWDRNLAGQITRPALHMEDQKTLRTVILVDMYPFKTQPPQNQLHAMAHQLGHAFGLWGHSDNPADLMYPLLHMESNDFPSRWSWRSAGATSHAAPVPVSAEGYEPSQRDINTLLRVYDQPASDLGAYSPY